MERATKFDERLMQAIVNNGVRWGSTSYFIGMEIEKARNKPELFVFAHADNGKEVAYIADDAFATPEVPRLNIPEKSWKPSTNMKNLFRVDKVEDRSLLLTDISVNGLDFEAAAIAVYYDKHGDQVAVDPALEEVLLYISPDEPPQSTQIFPNETQQYVIVIYPKPK